MDEKTDKIRADRRGFLKFAGLGTIASGAALAAGSAPDTAEARDSGESVGYRETDHVKAYYQSARF